MSKNIDWPVKSREFHNHHFDSTVWNNFKFRDDDIIISTYAKAGTTWMQQIIAQLIFAGDPSVNIAEMSPWLDLRFPHKLLKLAALEAQKHRRFVKSHLPLDALVFSPRAKYIYIGRDGRDVVWSMYNHHVNANQSWYDNLNKTPGLVGAPIAPPCADIHQYWHEWMSNDGQPWWPFWDNVRTWWAARELPNVLFVHYNDLKCDLPGQIDRIAAFLEIPVAPEKSATIYEHCSFEWMKKHAEQCVNGAGKWLQGGAETFINKGQAGRWKDTLSAQDVADYEQRAIDELGQECAAWLAHGSLSGRSASAPAVAAVA